MKKSSRLVLALVTGVFSSALLSSAAVAGADDAKLEELKRAMSAANSNTDGAMPTPKPRKRAIVFDNEGDKPAAAPSPAKVATAAAASDCAALPADVKATSVDFPIQFKPGSAALAPASEATVEQIAKILALSPDKCVLVEGHTDSLGKADSNMTLSKSRADSVVTFISGKGVDAKRLVAIGKGSSDLIKNISPSDPRNRRVVFKVVQ